ncbi:hypothetical protein KIN20_020131 [Parelaphostrongylus tenuis]|uniref:G-protein coupled receptors family 1 profile domain-containing protein n=1 Tax=Parelaphostrongylus tenuis TaxID=148309 RepID=A0AAD5N9H2_PARTN|nr:hypothetical protein KIN20_020131 [Parelaphostrongylus tenuis]
MLDGRSLTAEALARAAVVVAVEVLLLGTSFLNICVIFTTADLYDVIGCYLISLSVADLLAALFIVPLSLYSTLDPNWRFMGDNSLICKGSAYLQIALFCSTVYTFAWICIDSEASISLRLATRISKMLMGDKASDITIWVFWRSLGSHERTNRRSGYFVTTE